MNIMLVSVSERTREIGIRKSIGATDQQILGQFMIEAIVLTLIGGVIGVAVSFVFTGLARLYTTFQPFIRLEVIAAALLVTMAVGVIFGIVPALKAARKDPIESLR
jgi:putative ABC transport system permease protein